MVVSFVPKRAIMSSPFSDGVEIGIFSGKHLEIIPVK